MAEGAQRAANDKTAVHPARRFRRPASTGKISTASTTTPTSPSRLPSASFPARTTRPRGAGQSAYHNLIYFNEVDKGGHFAAWEQPQLFSEEVRAGLRPLRN
jgi:pimeloyl-ACP methyl ester carboxylesterase